MSTLVILGASITGLAVARDAHRLGLHPIVADQNPGPAWHSRWVTPVDLRNGRNARPLGQIARFGGQDAAVIATSDFWIRFLIEHRPQLSSLFGLIVQPPNATLELCLDKMAFSEWCFRSEFPCPPAWRPDQTTRPASFRLPALVRPAHTAHERRDFNLPKAVEVRTEEELNHWLQHFEARGVVPLVSESLLGRKLEQYSVPFARCNGQTLAFTARKVRPPADLCQTGTCVELWEDKKVEQLGRAVAERLDYFGIGEVEILRDGQTGKDYLIEINARPWLQYALAPASNHDFLGLVLNRSISSTGPAMRTGKTWIDLYQDLFTAFSRSIGLVRNRRLGLYPYVRSVARCNVFACFDWRDPGPFLSSLRRR